MSKFFKSNKLKSAINPNKIYMADWMKTRPYLKSSAYDVGYLEVCNEILPIARSIIEMGAYRMVDSVTETSQLLTFTLISYLEDFVNEIGLWKAFTDENKRLYRLTLPLIPLSKDYSEDDVNREDIQYLLWQFFIRATDDSLIIDPKDVILAEFAEKIHTIFIHAIDNVTVYATNFYQNFLIIKDEDNLIEVKEKLYWVAMNTFLFQQENTMVYKKKKGELEKTALENEMVAMNFSALLYSELNSFLYTRSGRFAALTAREVLARIADCSKKTRKNLRDTWQYSSGYFFTQNFISKDKIQVQPIYTNKYLLLDINTLAKENQSKVKPKNLWLMSLVKWGNSYGLSGMAAYVGDVNAANQYRLSLKESDTRALLGYQELMGEEYFAGMRQAQQQQALQFKLFFGNYFVFASSRKALIDYQKQFYTWYNSEIIPLLEKQNGDALSEEEHLEVLTKKANTPELHLFRRQLPEIGDHILVMHPEIGMSFENHDLCAIVNILKSNKIKPEDIATIFYAIIDLSPVLSSYIFKKYGFQFLKYGREDKTTTIEQMKKDLPYLQRFYQASEYNVMLPNISKMDTAPLNTLIE